MKDNQSTSELEIMKQFIVPTIHQQFQDEWQRKRTDFLTAYQKKERSFVPNLLPETAIQLSAAETLSILHERLGKTLDLALDPLYTDPENLPTTLPAAIRSPVADESDGSWLKQANMVGINVRTVQNFWNIVKYALTLPAAQDSVHILPIWEAGVVGSLYGMSSWQLNPEFYSAELAEAQPHLNTTGKQLKAVSNILHALGKTVGMDVIPHTDRYSQIVLASPQLFEWLQRQDTVIINHRANLHEGVQAQIWTFLQQNGSAVADEVLPNSAEIFFNDLTESQRIRLLFGTPEDKSGREGRRNQLIQYLFRYGYEPVPGTMAPPFRGLKVNTDPKAKTVDSQGMVWRDYLITEPQSMSRVFGPLSRYKLYERLDDNRDWGVDFDKPRPAVWQYVCENYADVQQKYGFDFMRGDMAHVQMRPNGVPDEIDDYYDILAAVKNYIRQEAPYFGYFAETFIAPRDVFGYGDELDHLEAADADTTLGDLQSVPVGSPVFIQRLRQYYDLLETRSCTPNFTLMTGDKDDPRFDGFYLRGNEARLFIAMFLTDMPSYMGLGFEVRNVHFEPAPNEYYSKLYVFQQSEGPQATNGDYKWGHNGHLFHTVMRLRLYLDDMFEQIAGRPCRWLLPPDAIGERKVIAWTQDDNRPTHLFVVNLDTEFASGKFGIPTIPNITSDTPLTQAFSTAEISAEQLAHNGRHYQVPQMSPGEGRVYRIG